MRDVDEADPIRRDGYIFVKSDYKSIRINFDEIEFVEGLKDYVKFHLTNNRKIMTLLNLNKLEEHLPKKQFKRVHRSYIANFDLFDYTDKSKLYYGEVGVPISETYKHVVIDFINRHTLY